jgi:polysaccharide export outer membrane protein
MGSRSRALTHIVLALSCLSLTGACTTRGGKVPYDVPKESFGQPDPPSTQAGMNSEYRIAPLDKLQITVFQVPDLTRDTDVDLGGNITVPLIGSVRAVDLTTAELQSRLEQQLNQRYLRNADVTVTVRESSRQNITIDGAVRQPGQFKVAGPTTLLQAVALARGPDETANPRRVAVFRHIQGKRMAAAFDLTAIRRGTAEDPVIHSGDIIVVDGSRVRALQREILGALPILGIFNPF